MRPARRSLIWTSSSGGNTKSWCAATRHRRPDRLDRPPSRPPLMASASWLTLLGAIAPTGAGVVVIPDARGSPPVLQGSLSDRFAEVGLVAVAIDFFARTAPERARLAECHRQRLTSPTGEG